ncbi:MAG: DUF4129 domain-containing protein [Bernardetiaceae bacterium]|jgi:hypothetical protein|nr:DUF4129 domain-containing protein [Bernardetiaceae bacterium]
MPKLTRLLLLLFAWLALNLPVVAQPTAPQPVPGPAPKLIDSLPRYQEGQAPKLNYRKLDSSRVEARQFDSGQLKEYATDSDFQYDRDLGQDASLMARVLNWLNRGINELFSAGVGEVLKWLMYVVAGVTLVYALVRLFGLDLPLNLNFKNQKPKDMALGVLDENIHAIDFDKQIAAALAKADYRLAVRLHYLRALKKMTDRGLIDWQPFKTNDDYVHELADENLRFGFNRLTLVFDYAWYGEFALDAAGYQSVRAFFDRFEDLVAKARPNAAPKPA